MIRSFENLIGGGGVACPAVHVWFRALSIGLCSTFLERESRPAGGVKNTGGRRLLSMRFRKLWFQANYRFAQCRDASHPLLTLRTPCRDPIIFKPRQSRRLRYLQLQEVTRCDTPRPGNDTNARVQVV